MLKAMEIVTGKWNNNKYIVLSKLGEGGIGEVYKVKDVKGNTRALKISKDVNSITREFNMMKNLKQIKNLPKVYEMDDYKKNGSIYYFLIMDYIEGYSIKDIIRYGNMKVKDIIGIGIILLNILEKIYKMGYIYSDIKPANIMIDKKGRKVSFIDFGGVTQVGRGIKEFTPTYSTFFWGIGRDGDYNTNIIFSTAMIISSMLLKKEFNPLLHSLEHIISSIRQLILDSRLKKCLIKALRGEINDIIIFKEELKILFEKCNKSLVVISNTNSPINLNMKNNLAVDIFFMLSVGFLAIVAIVGINIYFF